jgi:N-acetylneuraminate lyase
MEFEGVYPAIITPLNTENKFKEKEFRKVVEFNINSGANGFWVSGGTGESIYISPNEIKNVIKSAVDQSQDRAKIIAHVGSITTKESQILAESAANSGAHAICAVPPFFYEPNLQTIIKHYKAISEASGNLPFFVYNLPQSTGTEITPLMMSEIKSEIPNTAGLKHSGPKFTDMKGFINLNLSCFIGNANLMLPALTLGASGCIDGPLNAAPELWANIWNAFKKNNLPEAMEAQEKAIKFSNVIRDFDMHSSIKEIISYRLKIDCGSPVLPLPQLTKSEKSELISEVKQMNIIDIS